MSIGRVSADVLFSDKPAVEAFLALATEAARAGQDVTARIVFEGSNWLYRVRIEPPSAPDHEERIADGSGD